MAGGAAPRVLIVDDEQGMQTALREALSRRSYEVDCASAGEEALQLLERQPYALALCDIRMPGMTGMEVLNAAKRRRPDTPFVMMTAYGTIEDAVEAMKHGARDYLIKPFSFDVALSVVQSAMDEPASPAPATAAGTKHGNGRRATVVAASPAMSHLMGVIDVVADGKATVLLQGESGAGKEALAREIHARSPRRDRPFVAVNCAALPEGLLESELFGHEKGSFTGAVLSRKGRFELANGGTILLDEISEMPLSLQAKLLRVLQEHEVEPIGSSKPVTLDIRIIATTNRSLTDWVRQGNFREDLFYRLNVISLVIPPLRERREDILPLAHHLLEKHCRRNGRPLKRMSESFQSHLLQQDWRGNVRELENFIERAVLLCRDNAISLEGVFLSESPSLPGEAATGADLGAETAGQAAAGELFSLTLEEMERRMIIQTLQRVAGNRTRAAEQLGVSVRTIRNKIHQYGLQGI